VPIYQKSLDNVRGVINAKDLVRAAAGLVQNRPLAELLHEPLFVPRTTPVKRLFLTFKTRKVHMAVVVSEYGKVLGLVTMDDLLAQIFGVLRDERAALQDAPGRQSRVRTPARGVVPQPIVNEPGSQPVADDSGPVPKERLTPQASEQSAPVPLATDVASDATGPTSIATLAEPEEDKPARAPSQLGGPRTDPAMVIPKRPATDPGIAESAIPAGLRPSAEHAIPIYPAEELTPPAVDAAELAAEGEVEIATRRRP
jgi:hypothetical protein